MIHSSLPKLYIPLGVSEKKPGSFDWIGYKQIGQVFGLSAPYTRRIFRQANMIDASGIPDPTMIEEGLAAWKGSRLRWQWHTTQILNVFTQSGLSPLSEIQQIAWLCEQGIVRVINRALREKDINKKMDILVDCCVVAPIHLPPNHPDWDEGVMELAMSLLRMEMCPPLMELILVGINNKPGKKQDNQTILRTAQARLLQEETPLGTKKTDARRL